MNKVIGTTRSLGFGIVEVMISMVIALLGMIVIFQVFAISESYNRTAVSGSDAQQNGAYAVYVLQQEIRQAGWGFNSAQSMGCSVVAYSSTIGGPPAALTPAALMPVFAGAPANAYLLAPVVIVPAAAANASDGLEINYGSQPLLVAPVGIFANQATSTDPIQVTNPFGFNLGDAVLAVPQALPGTCMLGQMTKALPLASAVAPCASGATNCIVHDASATAYPYNKPGGFAGLAYTTSGFLLNLGPTLTRDVFSVVNNQLNVVASLSSNAQQLVADNIVQLKAQYGKDNGAADASVPGPHTANDGIVDSYDTVVPNVVADPANAWNQVLTLRIGVVARSAQPEKPSGGGPACNTTTVMPTWSGSTGANPNPFDLSANAQWQCYRYKVFETVIPLKNILWTQG